MTALDDPEVCARGAVTQAATSSVARDAAALALAVRDAALALGFIRVGFCPVEPFANAERALGDWLRAGYQGEMAYLAGDPRGDPSSLLPRARSLIAVALPYARAASAGELLPAAGLVARYARGDDYHNVLKGRLWRLADRCAELSGGPVLARPCVDTAPLLEHEAARRAGVGFTGKSTLTIIPGIGSYVLLGELLTDLELAPGEPVAQGCGGCRACLDACPTGAFVDAYTLDARRCISYLTIELRGSIPLELRPLLGRWVFGCDICQEVCPYNHSRNSPPIDPRLRPRAALSAVDLVALLQLSASGYRRLVKRTALRRVSRAQLQRNAAVALGNARQPETVPALAQTLADNQNALVREHVAWALGQLATDAARAALRQQLARESDASVRRAIDQALSL
jgi:epoxyqueuosine reductase